MRTWKRTLVMLAAAALTAGASAETMRWNFNSWAETKDWFFVDAADGAWKQGMWTTFDGMLIKSDDKVSAFALFGEEAWDNYTIEAKMRLDSGNENAAVGLVFRADFLWIDEFVCYAVCLRSALKGDSILFSRLRVSEKGGVSSRSILIDPFEDEFKIAPGEWFVMRVLVNGNNVLLFIDNKPQAYFSAKHIWDNESYLPNGGVGFYSRRAKMRVDYAEVSIGGDPLSVQPNGRLAAQWAQLKRG